MKGIGGFGAKERCGRQRGSRRFARKGKRLTAAVLAALLLCAQAGCGSGFVGGEKGETQAETADGGAAEGIARNASAQDGENQVRAMGRYMESKIPLPEESGYTAKTMTLLSDGGLAYFDGQAGLYVSRDEGASWEMQRSVTDLTGASFEKTPYVGAASISPEGSVGLICQEFPEGQDPVVTAVIADSNGSAVMNGNFADGDYLYSIFWRNEKEAYAVSLRGRICLLDPAGGQAKELFSASDRVEMLAFLGDRLLLLENGGVEIYDLAQKSFAGEDAVLSEFCRETFAGMLGSRGDSMEGILLTEGEDVVYLVCRSGIYRHVMGGTAMEQLVDGKFSVLNDERLGLCGFLALESGEFLLLTTGEELVRLTYDPNEPSRPEQQLTVYSLYEMSRISQAISAYQNQNPTVWVDYEIGIPKDSAVTVTDALKNLSMELMGGDGPDVLVMDGLDADTFTEKGVLMDLSGLLEELESGDGLTGNIADCIRGEEGTFLLPAAFALPMLCGKTEVLDQVTDMKSLAEAVEGQAASASGSVTGCFTADQEMYQLLDAAGESILSGREMDRAALTEFLTLAKRIYTANQTVITADWRDTFGKTAAGRTISTIAEFMDIGKAQLGFGRAEDMILDIGTLENVVEKGGYDIRLFGEAGNTGFYPVCELAVLASAKQPELAEEFVRLIFSGEMQKVSYYDGFPANRAAFRLMCEDQENQACFGGCIFLPDGSEEQFGVDYPSREMTQRLEELVAGCGHSIRISAFTREAVLKYGPGVLEGTMEIEEGVDAIEKAVGLYLAE